MSKKKNTVILWQPHAGPQTEFLHAKEFEVLFGGSKGPGKTDALVMDMLQPEYINNPKYHGLILRRTYPRMLEIKDRCDFYYKKVDPGCTYNKDEKRYTFSTGAKIRLGHCENEDDKWGYWGHEVARLAIDELGEFTESQYEILRLCARSTIPGLKPYIRATCNPGTAWVKQYFVDVAPPNEVFEYELPMPNGESIKLTRRFIPSNVYDNTTLLERDPQYLAVLQSIENDKLRRQMLYGDWDAIDSGAFEEFDKAKHVKKLHELFTGGRPPDGWMVAISMDWGYSSPFAIYWHCINPMDKIITFKEWYGVKYDPLKQRYETSTGLKMLAKDVAKGIVQRSQGLNVSFCVADRSIWNKTGQEQGSVGQEMELVLSEAGIPMMRSDSSKGSRAARKIQTHNRLSMAPDGQPWWLIADCCIHLIRTLPLLPLDPNNSEDIDTTADDHAWDGVSYGLNQFPVQLESSMSGLSSKVTRLDEYRRRIEGHNFSQNIPTAYSYH